MGYRDNYFNANSSNHGWYRCVSCGKSFRKGDIDIDHILPQHHGGSDDLDNLQCMCKHCNRSKQDDTRHSVEDYAADATGIRLGTHDEMNYLDSEVDNDLRKKKKFW